MKFMEKAKRFFTLKRRANDGFTLVELIVVIAILAILAGVAVPAYSGYIEKSKRAGDETLLAAVNKAFAAACMNNGVDVYTVDSATLTLSDGKVSAVNPYNDAFFLFYEGNEDAQFQVITALYFHPQLHVFMDANEAGGAYSGLLNNIVTNNPEWVTTLNGSIWMDNSVGLGTDGLLDKVNDVTKFAAAADSAALDQILFSPEFIGYAADVLGVDPTDMTAIETKFNDLAAEMVAQNPGMTIEQANGQLRANAAVLYAAENTKTMTADDVKALLGSDGAKGTITSNLSSDPGTAMSQAAIAYGMYTAYAYSTGDAALIESTNDPLSILNGLDNDAFQAYINNPDNAKDIDGYLAAMSMVSSSTGDMAAIDQLMVNGFNDPALSAMLNQLGSSK